MMRNGSGGPAEAGLRERKHKHQNTTRRTAFEAKRRAEDEWLEIPMKKAACTMMTPPLDIGHVPTARAAGQVDRCG